MFDSRQLDFDSRVLSLLIDYSARCCFVSLEEEKEDEKYEEKQLCRPRWWWWWYEYYD